MYACYIDESGHCGKKFNPNQPVEVIAGVVTDLTKLSKTQRQQARITDVIRSHGLRVSELKASDIYRGRGSWKKINPAVRDQVFEMLLNWIVERQCKFAVCPVDSASFFQKKREGCDISRRFDSPYEAGALNVLLSLQRHQQKKKNNKGKTFVIFDEQIGHSDNLLAILSEQDLSFTDGYTGRDRKGGGKRNVQRLDQIIDVPYFAKSHQVSAIQLADWAAFVVYLYLLLTVYGGKESYQGELSKVSKWYQKIGNSQIAHTAIDPPGNNLLCKYFRSIRPEGWTAKGWML